MLPHSSHDAAMNGAPGLFASVKESVAQGAIPTSENPDMGHPSGAAATDSRSFAALRMTISWGWEAGTWATPR